LESLWKGVRKSPGGRWRPAHAPCANRRSPVGDPPPQRTHQMHRSPPDGRRTCRSVLGAVARPRTWTLVAAMACTGVAMLPTGTRADIVPDATAAPAPVGQGFVVTPSDLAFILKQIKIAERHSRALARTEPTAPAHPHPDTDPMYCQSMVGTGPDQIPSRLLSFGLRAVDG